MKRKISALVLMGTLLPAICWADVQPFTDIDDGSDPDACGAALCLTSAIRDGDCNKYIDKYFDIEKYRNGHFSPSRTKEARWDFLQQCKDDTEEKFRANEKWGPVKRGF